MEQKNKRIINEYLLLKQAYGEALHNAVILNGYTWYNDNMKNWYKVLIDKYNSVLGINMQNDQEVISILNNMELTQEQKRALKEIQREPIFKKLMGEVAIVKKDILERITGQEITDLGMIYADERGPIQSVKSVDVLEKERQALYDKLSKQLSLEVITQEQYEKFLDQVDYIYNYYESISMAEQIPFRKLSDSDIAKIQNKANEQGISFNQVLNEINHDLIEEFKNFYAEINATNIQDTTITNPKYAEFKAEIEKKQKDIELLNDRKKQLEALLDKVYSQESQLSKALSFEERSYQKLLIQIKAKELEIKIMDIEASIKGSENWIQQKEFGILRMEGIITPQQYSFQIDEAKINYSINDNYANMTHLYEENELYAMQIRLLGMQETRGEITVDRRNMEYQELKRKISKNEEYILSLQEDLTSERKKQIEKQIAFRYSEGIITKETRQAQIDALHSLSELTEQSQVDISNVFVDEYGFTHRPVR